MMRRAGFGLLLCMLAAGVGAQDQSQARTPAERPAETPAPIEPVGPPLPEQRLRDKDFGVSTRHFGLERTVEMYQWNRAGEGYFAGWSLEPVDSTAFVAGHANPGKFPLQSREWRALRVTLDGKPLSSEVVAKLGQWRSFRPNFSALPGNLSATFQPEGDGLGSAENPLDPQIGDLRVTWRELVLPPLQGQVALRNGEWVLPNSPVSIAAPTEDDGAIDDSGRATSSGWLVAGGLLVLLAAAFAYRRRKRKRSPHP